MSLLPAGASWHGSWCRGVPRGTEMRELQVEIGFSTARAPPAPHTAAPCGGTSQSRSAFPSAVPVGIGPEKAISPPEAPKPQAGEVKRFPLSSDERFPTYCTLEAALAERAASPATAVAEWGPRRAPPGSVAAWAGLGGTAVRGCPGKAPRAGEGRGWGMLLLGGLGGGFPLRDLCHPRAPVKRRFLESAWKPPAEDRKEGVVRKYKY